jgi:hypothetical protein
MFERLDPPLAEGVAAQGHNPCYGKQFEYSPEEA